MIDNNGKVFGKINLIDLFVGILIIAIVIVVGWRVLSGTQTAAPVTATTLTYTVEVDDVTPEIYENILEYIPGDQLMASGELLPAYVIDITAEAQESPSATLSNDWMTIFFDTEDLLTVTFTISAQIEDLVINEIGTQEVRIGKTHIVKTQHFEFYDGVITDCVWE